MSEVRSNSFKMSPVWAARILWRLQFRIEFWTLQRTASGHKMNNRGPTLVTMDTVQRESEKVAPARADRHTDTRKGWVSIPCYNGEGGLLPASLSLVRHSKVWHQVRTRCRV